jgi:hypothetical protein
MDTTTDIEIAGKSTARQRWAIYRLFSHDVAKHLTESEASTVIGLLLKARGRLEEQRQRGVRGDGVTTGSKRDAIL